MGSKCSIKCGKDDEGRNSLVAHMMSTSAKSSSKYGIGRASSRSSSIKLFENSQIEDEGENSL